MLARGGFLTLIALVFRRVLAHGFNAVLGAAFLLVDGSLLAVFASPKQLSVAVPVLVFSGGLLTWHSRPPVAVLILFVDVVQLRVLIAIWLTAVARLAVACVLFPRAALSAVAVLKPRLSSNQRRHCCKRAACRQP